MILALFSLSACGIEFGGKKAGNDVGGIFVSNTSGDSWTNMSKFYTNSSENGSISTLDTSSLILDPSDDTAVYFASMTSGLFYAYDISLGWRRAVGLPSTRIGDVKINPNSKCMIYASAGNKVYKSTDCNRNWKSVYYDDQSSAFIYSIAIDHYNDNRVYIGTSRGEIILSENSGESWRVINDVGSPVLDIAISPQDSRIIFFRTQSHGVFRSLDGGENWISLKDVFMEEFKNSSKISGLDISAKDEGTIIVTTPYGMLKSKDNGEIWERIELITPEKETQINDVVMDNLDPNIIYYTTDSKFYRTNDNGKTWTARNLPTQRRGWKIIVDPDETGLLYLGVRAVEDKKGFF